MSDAPNLVAPGLRRWSESAPPDEERTVIVRVAFSVSPEEVTSGLNDVGARIETQGAGVVVCRVVPSAVARLAEFPWVRAVDEPRELQLRAGGDGFESAL